ncbi:CDK-activating kinase assembly factor MAT1 [Seonamhaeicola maritimus]|uniref:DUF4097 domain-containing protein n=1 Tax=Seonamhaeicola maritimus TaxID=2591822 RepID=A0A5C7GKF6_9FLAO|nr:hypothetical protein [Seonamhaeicola maritimus]TXG38949.1 hypothetical protein FUA22_03405 [Seonamhaeicola maritimus]
MNRLLIKLKLLVVAFFTVSSLIAQKQTKVSQSIKVDKDVTIDLNTSYCNIVFDTWNKDTVEIEAFIEGDNLSDEEIKDALKNWNVDVDASSNEITITTNSFAYAPRAWAYRTAPHDDEAVNAVLRELKYELAELPEILGDLSVRIHELPALPEMPAFPELPALPENAKSFHFDYEAYKKDGEKYLEEYTKRFESAYGDDYAKKMEVWGEKFGKEWGEKYGKQMEEWAEKFEKNFDSEEFEKKMEAWGERFAEKMEQQAERVEEQQEKREKLLEKAAKDRERALEKREAEREKLHAERKVHQEKREKLAKERKVLIERLVHKESNSNVKKTIKIKMPKKAKLKVNVKHGEIEFAANIDNLKADLAYTKLTANSINGGLTSINASYSPVYVSNWNLGELNLNYAKQVELNNVKQVVLNSNSSNVTIDNLIGNAIIDANIGDIKILKIDDAFTNLNVIIQNCDAIIALPKVDCNLQYKGNRSRLSHPKKETGNLTTFSTGNLSSGKSIVVNAKYSNVTME